MAISLKRRTDKPAPDAMTLTEHLTELRRRVLVSVAAFVVGATVAFLAYNWILGILKHPYCQVAPTHCGFYVTGPLDGLALRIKISAYGGIFLASPVWLWELWRFITPGLKPNEKKYAIPFVGGHDQPLHPGCGGRLPDLPARTAWLDSIGGPSLTQILDPNKYLSLIILLMVAFGVTFEFPVLLVSLEVAGVLTPQQLSSWRRWAIIGIVVLAGVITPSSDPFSMLAMAVPLYLFYELSIVIGRIVRR